MKRTIIFTCLFLIISILICDPSFAQKMEYRRQPTDILRITVHEQPDLETKTRVTSDGCITFPLIGKIKTKGMTVQELENEIKELLEKDYLVRDTSVRSRAHGGGVGQVLGSDVRKQLGHARKLGAERCARDGSCRDF